MNRKMGVFLTLIIFLVAMPNIGYSIEEPSYRALIIGNGGYGDEDELLGPLNDINKMENALKHNYFGTNNIPFTSIVKKQDLDKATMLHSIGETFKDAKEGDISYFYFSGHGSYDSYTNTSYIIGIDGYGLSVYELERELRKIPGKVVVILDSCNSGGFINKGYNIMARNEPSKEDYIEQYNQSIIDAFSQKKRRGYLIGDKYKVITAAAKNEYSYEIYFEDGWNWGGEFTRAFVKGNGYNGEFLADANYDDNVTLEEIYYFTSRNVMESNVQVYPMKDSFIIGSKCKEEPLRNTIDWDTFYNIPLDKAWNIRFNMDLDDDSWKDRIYILDYNNHKFPIEVGKNRSEENIYIKPLINYDCNSKYSIVIRENISSKKGKKLKDRVIATFYTEEGEIYYEELSLDTVLNGHFHGYPYPSIEIAFENFFGYPTWEYFYSTDNYHIVEFNGMASRDEVPGNITIQFTVDVEEESFIVNYVDFNGEVLSRYEFDGLLGAVYDNYFNIRSNKDLKNIFSDKDDSPLLDNYIEK